MYKAILPAAVLLSVGTLLSARTPVRPQVMESYGKLPLSFEANQGQTDQRVKFLARGPGYTLFLTADLAAVLSLHGKDANATLRMKLLGANTNAAVAGANELPGKSNYFTGSDPRQWRTNVPTYGAVKYAGVYPGIDLIYHGDQRLLEYDFVLAPGADPRAIDLRFQGAKKLTVNAAGALVINVGGSEVIEHAPVVYQEIGGQRQTVAGGYVLRGIDRVGFSIALYDRSRSLVIDPTLVYSTYLGRSGHEGGWGIAVDNSGNAYVTGWASSSDFPTTPGSFENVLSPGGAFVTKLNTTVNTLVYSTYLGVGAYGSIAVDVSGNAYITGYTTSSDFPTTPGAFQASIRGSGNTFVAKLNATGSALVYSTYLGGSGWDEGYGIAIDASGNAYVTGNASSSDFPITPGAFQTDFPTSMRSTGFVSKLNATGSALLYSTYLGSRSGASATDVSGIAVDASGNAYVTGYTGATDFPVTPGVFQMTGRDTAFVSKLNAAGSHLVYSTYLSERAPTHSQGIALDTSGNAYVTGISGPGLPTTSGAFQTSMHGLFANAFVTKLNATGTALSYSTYLGGSPGEVGMETFASARIAVDSLGNAFVTGLTYSPDFPTTPGAFQTVFGGWTDAFLSKLNPTGSALLYSTFLGGSGQDEGYGVAVDSSGNVYVTGGTFGSANTNDFPTTTGAFQTTYAGGSDAFVTKLSLGGSTIAGPATTVILSGPRGNNGWYLGPVTVTLTGTAGSNPISAIYYSVDSGPYQAYGSSFQISTDGTHQLLFYSVDTANRQETPHGQNFKIDSTKPVSHVAALPATATSPNFSVQWSGTDAGSGLLNYSIFVSDNGSPFGAWLNQTTAAQAWFAGSLGHTYRFYCSAQDQAGNIEIKTAADATTFVPQMPGDINGDGKIDCADLTLVKASFGKRTGQAGFNPAADVNHDGVVDVRDLAIVSQKLIPGTSCP